MIRVVHDIAAVDAPDGVVFEVTAIEVREIREHAEYPAYRVRVPASIGAWRGTATWDVSTGDPIVPAPRLVRLERLLGPPLQLLGYSAETAVAEKGVTILERGITSTRWRDYVDIVQLAAQGIDTVQLRRAAQAVARHRGITLEPITPHLAGYGQVGQLKWAAWRRKQHLEATSEELLDAQVELVAEVLDPAFRTEPEA